MIIASQFKDKLVQKEIGIENSNLLHDSIWIDLINPSVEEESLVEHYLDLNIPTREEMREIELSSRFMVVFK